MFSEGAVLESKMADGNRGPPTCFHQIMYSSSFNLPLCQNFMLLLGFAWSSLFSYLRSHPPLKWTVLTTRPCHQREPACTPCPPHDFVENMLKIHHSKLTVGSKSIQPLTFFFCSYIKQMQN